MFPYYSEMAGGRGKGFDLCAGYMGSIVQKDNSFAEWLKSGEVEESEVLYQGAGFNYIIYGKLDVTGRASALKKAMELKII